ncbi:putative periplasmic binding protein [Yersinia pestis Pestoides A]|nr:putative periplasmic binding protein [Yersinia pestis Pestoides A]
MIHYNITIKSTRISFMLLRIFWSLCLWWGISSSALAEIHLKDVDGREVTLAAPSTTCLYRFLL